MTRCSQLVPWLGLFLAGCSSVAWQPRPTEQMWRGASLWCAEGITIAARTESDAEEMLGVHFRLWAAFAAIGEAPPSAPLILAVAADDEPLLGDGLRTMQALAGWFQEALGTGRVPVGDHTNLPPDASKEMVAGLAKIVAAPVPLTAPEVALPASWQQRATWAVVVPTDGTTVAVADMLLDEGLAKEDIGFGQRLLMAPLMPWIRGMMRDQFRELVWRQLVDLSCSPRMLGRPFSPEKKVALLAALGLPATMQPPDTTQVPALPTASEPGSR